MIQPICANCKHWNTKEPSLYWDNTKFECGRVGVNESQVVDQESNAQISSDWHAQLYTAPEFGCNQFEASIAPLIKA